MTHPRRSHTLILVMATGVACTARPPSPGPRSVADEAARSPVARSPVTPAPADPTTTPSPVRFCSDGRVFIPGGTFAMGTHDHDRSGPVHEVTLSPYCLDRTDVTVQAFERCVIRQRARSNLLNECVQRLGLFGLNHLLHGLHLISGGARREHDEFAEQKLSNH